MLGMDAAMKSMNLEKISTVMDKFEQQFEDLDVQSQYMENSMGNTTSMATPQEDVERLMLQVAEEHGLELNMQMSTAPTGVEAATVATAEKDDLSNRLAK
eukprot:Partr_v1_DN22707_c0_g1_i3_m37631 putative Charged multivesicular body protein